MCCLLPSAGPTSCPLPVLLTESGTGSRSLGYNQSRPSALLSTYLNRWSRYLSKGYVNVNGAPAWTFVTVSNFIADGRQFAPAPLKPPFTWAGVRDQGECSE